MQAITAGSSINHQSFFKLPLIFIAIFFVIDFVGMQTILFFMSNMSVEFLLENLVYGVLSLLLPLFLFFVTAVFCCQKYRLHSVIDSWRKMTLITIVFALLHLGRDVLLIFCYGFLISSLYEVMAMLDMAMPDIGPLMSTIFFIDVAASILFIFILIFLFYLFAKKDVSLRTVFELEGIKGSRVYSHIYSFLMLFLTILITSYYHNYILNFMSISLGLDRLDIIALLIIFITLFIYYITAYFSTRNRFKRIEPTAKLGKLIVTTMITYLFILSSSIITVGVLFILFFLFLMQKYYMDGILLLMVLLFIVSNVINLLLCFVFCRLSVKIMYS